MDIAPNMSHVAFGTDDRLVVLMDYERGTNQEYIAHQDSVTCVKFHIQNNDLVLYSGGYGDLCRWKFSQKLESEHET